MLYIVRPGDTLSAVARAFSVSVDRLRSDNGIPADQPLVPGQCLVVLRPRAVYDVRPGDTLASVAAGSGVSVRRLYQLNPTLTGSGLRAGQVLTLALEEDALPSLVLNGYAYPHTQPQVLRWALPFLSALSVFSFGFQTDGTLVEPEDSFLLTQAEAFGCGRVLVLTSIDGSGTFSTERAAALFRDRALQDKVLEELLGVMEGRGYQGLDMDFEYIAPEDAPAYFAFLRNARDRLHSRGRFLHVDLAPKTYAAQPGLLYAAHDYREIGAVADSVLLMTYEWGYAYGPPMAVAPLPNVERVLRYGLTEIPAEKVRMGIPNYGYDWTLPYTPGTRAVTLGNREAVTLAAETGAEIGYDETARTPFFRYTRQGAAHQVWFEDARSVKAKLDLALTLGLGGAAWWSLLRPFPQNWALVSQTAEGRSDGMMMWEETQKPAERSV